MAINDTPNTMSDLIHFPKSSMVKVHGQNGTTVKLPLEKAARASRQDTIGATSHSCKVTRPIQSV